jgi:two-component system, NarL family, sensor histidine kinase UhpB
VTVPALTLPAAGRGESPYLPAGLPTRVEVMTTPPQAPLVSLPAARARRPGQGRHVAGRRNTSLYARVVAVNATILLAAVLALTFTPATVSFPVTADEWTILGVGLALLVVANAVLLRISFRGLTALVRQMETLDLLQPRERLPEMGGPETRALIAGFNTMLDRLEAERRASVRRTITGMEAERQRIGQELHDEIGQRLTGVLLQLGRIHDDAPASLRARVEGVQEETRATIDEVGALAHQVRPGVLTDLGLRSGLDALVDSFRQHGTARVDASLPDRLPPMTSAAELAVYRITQEALTNAARHAEATRIAVAVDLTADELVLQVTDDGRGLDDAAGEDQGMRGMRERALLIGGRLRIDSPPSRGVRVRLAVPAANLTG